MEVFINSTNRTGDIIRNSIVINDELQEKANTMSFSVAGSKPSYYQNVEVYESFKILSVTGTQLKIDYDYNTNVEVQNFRVGDELIIDIQESGELKKTITAIGSDNGKTIFTLSPSGSDGTVGKLAGKRFLLATSRT